MILPYLGNRLHGIGMPAVARRTSSDHSVGPWAAPCSPKAPFERFSTSIPFCDPRRIEPFLSARSTFERMLTFTTLTSGPSRGSGDEDAWIEPLTPRLNVSGTGSLLPERLVTRNVVLAEAVAEAPSVRNA